MWLWSNRFIILLRSLTVNDSDWASSIDCSEGLGLLAIGRVPGMKLPTGMA